MEFQTQIPQTYGRHNIIAMVRQYCKWNAIKTAYCFCCYSISRFKLNYTAQHLNNNFQLHGNQRTQKLLQIYESKLTVWPAASANICVCVYRNKHLDSSPLAYHVQ